MDLLKQKILEKGRVVGNDILKVDSFLNHQIDVSLAQAMGKDIYEKFAHKNITKILTIETSGIGLACITAQYFNCDIVFAKKHQTRNLAGDMYTAMVHSFTHGNTNEIRVCKDYITNKDTILIIDDFLANGKAIKGLMEIVNQAGAKLAGAAIAIEKGFQGGGDALRAQGIDVYSLAIVDKMDDGNIIFR